MICKEELERRALEIKDLLRPWAGMTLAEARLHGWTEEQDLLQAELWWIGYESRKTE